MPYIGPSNIPGQLWVFWVNVVKATYLKRIIEIANFAKIVQELIDPRLIVLYKWIQRGHVCLLRV